MCDVTIGLVHHEMSRISRLTISEMITGLESQVHGGSIVLSTAMTSLCNTGVT